MVRKSGSYNVYIGDVALDEYYRAGRWPGTADKEEVETLEAVPGGMIANAACVSAATHATAAAIISFFILFSFFCFGNNSAN